MMLSLMTMGLFSSVLSLTTRVTFSNRLPVTIVLPPVIHSGRQFLASLVLMALPVTAAPG